ncbi:unnamed protein product, partial [Allacma fusca]
DQFSLGTGRTSISGNIF